ncbi:MAG: hypothetical protein HYV14_03520 [Elusimicrobia bacterium]|nr:hypothetical protein [Elusimicrobiota bacterium]
MSSANALQNAFAAGHVAPGSSGTATCRPLPPVVFRKAASPRVSRRARFLLRGPRPPALVPPGGMLHGSSVRFYR